MLHWSPSFTSNSILDILCLGAHCDDIEIGCGGLLLQLANSHSDAHFRIVIFSSTPERESETRAALSRFLTNAKNVEIDVLNFRNSYFPYIGSEIKTHFESLKSENNPDLILTHHRNDRHQDHRLISDLTWNMYRDHSILEYEIPKYDGDLGQPNVYVALDESATNEKIENLIDCFPSQSTRSWFTEETFRSLLRLRGIECNAKSGYAEAFYANKMSLLI